MMRAAQRTLRRSGSCCRSGGRSAAPPRSASAGLVPVFVEFEVTVRPAAACLYRCRDADHQAARLYVTGPVSCIDFGIAEIAPLARTITTWREEPLTASAPAALAKNYRSQQTFDQHQAGPATDSETSATISCDYCCTAESPASIKLPRHSEAEVIRLLIMFMSGQRYDVDPKNDKAGTQLQICASQMKCAARSAMLALALLMVTTSLWLVLRDVSKSSTVHSWRTFAAAAIPFSATDLVNPKRGQYQDAGITLYPRSATSSYPAWPGTYDAGDRFLWSQIQPANADNYDFTSIDKQIAAARAHNQRFHFRIMAFASCCGDSGNTVMGVPQWLHATPGATTYYYSGGEKYVVPNWNADAYLTPLEHLIAALGARYDHDERVEWFEFSGYGDFSENHIWFIAENLRAPGPSPENSIAQLGYYSQFTDQSITKASITRMVNATLTAFPDTQIIVAGDNPEITRQLLAASPRRPVGIRADCLGVYPPPQLWATRPDSWYVQHHDPVVTALLARWRTAPVVTEWCNDQPNGAAAYFQQAIEDTVNYHVSLVASNVVPPTSDTYDIWARTNKYAGYRYAITSATVPDSATPGSVLPITVRWTNFGTAPSYDNWQVVYELRDSENAVVKTVQSAQALHNIGAEQNYTTQDPASATNDDTFTLPTSGLPAGDYMLAAKVVWNDHKPKGIDTVNYSPMTLAQAGRDGDGGYPIGSIQLTR